ncbi:MAG: TRAP transporter small permease [Paracoccaceae bacterium]
MIAKPSLRRASDVLNHIVIAVCVALAVAMLSISTLGIFLRIVFAGFEYFGLPFEFFHDSPLDWAYSHTRPSMTRLFLPWLAMLSLTVAFKRGEHIAIAIAVRNLPPRVLRLVQVANLGLVGLFGGALTWYGYLFFDNATQLFMVSDTFQVSHKWTNIAVPVCGLIMCVHLLSGVSLVEIREYTREADE